VSGGDHPAARLRAACAHLTERQYPAILGGEPDGRWLRLDALADSSRLAGQIDAAATRWRGGRRGAGGIVLVSQVARAVLS
jgi:hypothetical protein